MNSIIKGTVLNVTQRFLKQESKTNKKLDNILNKKFEKVELNENKYIDLLKYNVLFYKTLSRNTEPIVSKWILEKYIPDIDELESDLELINAKCRKYINIAKRDGIDKLKDADVQSFNYYDKMDNSEKIKRLQKDYKVLNIYMEVLTMTLRELSLRKEDSVEIFLMNPSDARMELKREIILIVNRILSGGNNKKEELEEDELENTEEVNENNIIDVEFAKRIKFISNAEINDNVEQEYKRILKLENLEKEDAFGFGGRVIYEFAAATVLIEFLKSRSLIEGAMRLTVSGEFGEENFSEFIAKVIKEKKFIEIETWKEACKYFRKNKDCLEATTPATSRRTLPVDIDIEEYIYMLENADKTEPFRNRMTRKIEPSIIIPAVKIKEVEKVEENISTEENLDNLDNNIETNNSDNVEINESNDINTAENVEENYEIHKDLEKRRKAIENIERKELEEERQERIKQEEINKENDPVERAKKAVNEIKREIEIEEETTEEEDKLDSDNKKYNEEIISAKEDEEENDKEVNEEENDLNEISKIAGIEKINDEEIEEDEEEESKKGGIFSIFKRKNKYDENADEDIDEKSDYEEDEYYTDEEAVENSNIVETEEEIIEYVDDDYEGDDVEIEEEVVIVPNKDDKKSRKKLDFIIAILIIAVVATGYFLTINRKKQQEEAKQEQIKAEQQIEEQKQKEEQRKKEEAEKIAAEEAKRAEEIEKAKTGGEYYRVYAGSLKDKENAENLIEKLDKKGLKGEIITIGSYYKVFVGGDTGVYSEAKKELSTLKSKGFSGYIEKYDRYCDLKIEDFRLKAKSMNKEETEQAYNTLKEELQSRKNFNDYSKIMDKTYEEIMSSKTE